MSRVSSTVGQHFGALGLPDAGGTFDEEGFLEGQHQLQRRGEGLGRDEAVRAEPLANGRRLHHDREARYRSGSGMNRALHCAQQKIHRAVDLGRVPRRRRRRRPSCKPDPRLLPAAQLAPTCSGRVPPAAGVCRRRARSAPPPAASCLTWDEPARSRRGWRARPLAPSAHRGRGRPGCDTGRAAHAAAFEKRPHRRATFPRRDEADVGHAALQDDLERLLVVVALRGDDGRHVGAVTSMHRSSDSSGATVTPSAPTRRRDRAARSRRPRGRPRSRGSSPCASGRRRPVSCQPPRAAWRGTNGSTYTSTAPSDTQVIGTTTCSGSRLTGLGGIGPDRHQAGVPRPHRFERLLPDDLARARARRRSRPCARPHRRSRDRPGARTPARDGRRPSPPRTAGLSRRMAATFSKKSFIGSVNQTACRARSRTSASISFCRLRIEHAPTDGRHRAAHYGLTAPVEQGGRGVAGTRRRHLR